MMIRAGVIGYPISHSKSPYIHGYWLKKYGIDGEYKAYEIRPETLETDIHDLVHAGVSGFNVTLPHKQNMMRLCQTLTDEARLIGAVNTVTVLKNGDLHGDNTDAFGFTQNLEKTIPGFDWTKKQPQLLAQAVLHGPFYTLSAKKLYLKSGLQIEHKKVQKIWPDSTTPPPLNGRTEINLYLVQI